MSETPDTDNPETAEPEGRRILIVDDEEGIRSSFLAFVQGVRPHYTVEAVSSAEEALVEIEQKEVDLLITDYKLLDMDGLALARLVRERSPRTWSIIMTAYGTTDTRREAYEEGCIAYVDKPFDPTEMLEWIDKGLSQTRRIPELSIPRYSSGSFYMSDILAMEYAEADQVNSRPWFTPDKWDSEDEWPGFSLFAKIRQTFVRLFCKGKVTEDEAETE